MKTFTVIYDYDWRAEFKIDVAKAAPVCRESIEFFGDPIERKDDSDEELVKAFLKFWAPTLLRASLPGNLEPILSQMAREEGCPALDGSQGITFITCDTFEFDRGNIDIDVEEATP